MTSTENSYRIITRRGWPEGYVIVCRKGALWTADRLCEINGFTPQVMRVSLADFDQYDDEGPGDYLLLPREQAERWHAAVKQHDGRPGAIFAALGHPAGADAASLTAPHWA